MTHTNDENTAVNEPRGATPQPDRNGRLALLMAEIAERAVWQSPSVDRVQKALLASELCALGAIEPLVAHGIIKRAMLEEQAELTAAA